MGLDTSRTPKGFLLGFRAMTRILNEELFEDCLRRHFWGDPHA